MVFLFSPQAAFISVNEALYTQAWTRLSHPKKLDTWHCKSVRRVMDTVFGKSPVSLLQVHFSFRLYTIVFHNGINVVNIVFSLIFLRSDYGFKWMASALVLRNISITTIHTSFIISYFTQQLTLPYTYNYANQQNWCKTTARFLLSKKTSVQIVSHSTRA